MSRNSATYGRTASRHAPGDSDGGRTLRLTREERRFVDSFRSTGRRAARQVTRAHALAALDDGVSVAAIAAVLGVDRTTLWRLRSVVQAYGVGAVLAGRSTPGRPPTFPPEVVQWVCRRGRRLARAGTPASLAQLRDAAQRHWGLESLSRETVRRWLARYEVADCETANRDARVRDCAS